MNLRADYPAIYEAWRNFRKGKRPSRSIDEFAYYLEENIMQLSSELENRTYRHGGYKRVILHEKKRRDLAVAVVRDRIVHRLLYDYLVKVFDRTFDHDVWSCRVGKGLHKCLARTQCLLSELSHSYVWRADIIKFFDNVDHQTLLNCLKRKIGSDKRAMWLCAKVTDSYNANRSQKPEARRVSRLAI